MKASRLIAASLLAAFTILTIQQKAVAEEAGARSYWVQLSAKDKFERSRIADLGITIEAVRSDSVWAFATDAALDQARKEGFRVLGKFSREVGRGGHHGADVLDFPGTDAKFHNYSEMTAELDAIVAAHPDLTRKVSIGKTVEGRDIWALHINSDPAALKSGKSGKPGAIFMGAHHAREHVSVEVPILLAQHLVKNRADAQVKHLIENRDIWIIPMVNPDGAEYDIASGSYQMWRKNRTKNADGTKGVDLNRNYGYRWGTGGSSKNTSDETYMGTAPFSEPETVAIRDFVRSQANTRVLLSFHTFSELILYPWGHTHDPISVNRDRRVFETMATTMSGWNGYKPQAASDLYIASGDTVDWAYGELGIFAFTFELSPNEKAVGFPPNPRKGFYPGASVIDGVFQANLLPCFYLMAVAEDPYQVIVGGPTSFLKNYVEPKVPSRAMSLIGSRLGT